MNLLPLLDNGYAENGGRWRFAAFIVVLAGTLMRHVSYKILFPYAALFVALSFVTMCFVRHGDSKAEAKRGLDAFEEMD